MIRILIVLIIIISTTSCSNLITFTKNQPQKKRVISEYFNPNDKVWRQPDLDMNGCFIDNEIDERSVITISSFEEDRVAKLFFYREE